MPDSTATDLLARFHFDGPAPESIGSAEEALEVVLDPTRRGELYPYLHRLRELEPRLRSEALHGHPAWICLLYTSPSPRD